MVFFYHWLLSVFNFFNQYLSVIKEHLPGFQDFFITIFFCLMSVFKNKFLLVLNHLFKKIKCYTNS
ncbi:hypothetical protein A6S26_23895 [Nostoc sp. ATCC 43529]|nr:hypothetical protein A6S26_23895 [Nostoc sp. ATCC 43529]